MSRELSPISSSGISQATDFDGVLASLWDAVFPPDATEVLADLTASEVGLMVLQGHPPCSQVTAQSSRHQQQALFVCS